MFIWIYQNQEGDCLNDIVSGALVVVSMDAQLSWVLHPHLTGGHFKGEWDVQVFLNKVIKAVTTGETLQLRRAEEGAVRSLFLGLFWRTGNALSYLLLSQGQEQLSKPYKMLRHRGKNWEFVPCISC